MASAREILGLRLRRVAPDGCRQSRATGDQIGRVHHLRPGIHKLLHKCGFGNRVDIQSTHLVRIGLVVVFRMDSQPVTLGRGLAREAIVHH